MKRTNNLKSPSLSIFADPKTNWSGRPYIEKGPLFRQLPAATSPSTETVASVSERRRATRRQLQLGIEIYGYDGELSLIHAYGTTQNVSASGLFAFVDVDLPIGSRAVVAVRPSHPALEPSILRGKVVRCARQANGYGLAIHFDLDVQRFAFEAA
ncbi:MAG: PilZ domain-containing protein [Acidobacteriota bacterium]